MHTTTTLSFLEHGVLSYAPSGGGEWTHGVVGTEKDGK